MLETLKKISLEPSGAHEQALIKARQGTCLIDVVVDCLGSKNEDVALLALEFLGQLLSIGNLACSRAAYCGLLEKATTLT